MNKTTNIRRRLRNRAGKRGAAMVEGIVIISGMLMFLGLIVWSRNAWGKKVDLQQQTRADSLYYASHACKDKGGGSGADGAGGNADLGGGPNVGGAAGQAGGAEGSTAGSGSFGKAKANAEQTVNWQAVFNVGNPNGAIQYQRRMMTSQVKSASEVLCNEPKYGNQLTAWAQFAIDLFRSGGGIGSLFR